MTLFRQMSWGKLGGECIDEVFVGSGRIEKMTGVEIFEGHLSERVRGSHGCLGSVGEKSRFDMWSGQ